MAGHSLLVAQEGIFEFSVSGGHEKLKLGTRTLDFGSCVYFYGNALRQQRHIPFIDEVLQIASQASAVSNFR